VSSGGDCLGLGVVVVSAVMAVAAAAAAVVLLGLAGGGEDAEWAPGAVVDEAAAGGEGRGRGEAMSERGGEVLRHVAGVGHGDADRHGEQAEEP
jgi:hypothetical protein